MIIRNNKSSSHPSKEKLFGADPSVSQNIKKKEKWFFGARNAPFGDEMQFIYAWNKDAE